MKVWQHIIRASVVIRHWAVIIAIGVLVYYVVNWGERAITHYEKPALVNQVSAPKDTATVIHLQPITNNYNNITYPAKVEKEAKPDTLARKQAEKGAIVTGEEISNGVLKVQKIDSAGNKTESDYAVKPTDKITEGKDGKVNIEPDKKAEKKNKLENTWRDVKAFSVGFGAGFVLGKATK